MPMRDEKEYGNKPMITELDPEDERDEVAVYGADDQEGGDQDDVVTSDEMGDEGDEEMPDVDLSSETDFEADDDEISSEDGDEFSDDEVGDDEVSDSDSSDLELFHQFRDILSQIVQSNNPDMEDDELEAAVEEAFNHYINEDASFAIAMTKHARRKSIDWEPSDVDDLIEQMKHADTSSVNLDTRSLDKNKYYHVVKTVFENTDSKVYNIISEFDLSKANRIRSEVDNENREWKSFYSNLVDQFDPSTAQNNNPEAAENKFDELKALKREHFIFSGNKVKSIVAEAQQNSNIHIIVNEELQGESFVSKKNILEADAKSIASQTRKTHSVSTDDKVYDGLAILKDMAGVIFQGKVKSFADLGKGVTAGYKGSQAKARRGDKRNGDKSAESVKEQAVIEILSRLQEMSTKQVEGLLKAFDDSSDIRSMVKESIDFNFNDDLEAFETIAESEGLSESFIKDTKLVMETGMKSKVESIAENIAIKMSQKLNSKTKAIQNAMIEKLNEYLDYMADQYMEENRLAIEEGQRAELSNNLLEGVFKVFRENNVDVPEGKENLLVKEQREKAKLEEEIENLHKIVMSYRKKGTRFMREAIIARHKEDLSTLKEKNEFVKKANGIQEWKDEIDFEEKVKGIKRLYFTENRKVINKNNKEFDTLVETVENDNNGTPMDAVLEALNKQMTSKNYNKQFNN